MRRELAAIALLILLVSLLLYHIRTLDSLIDEVEAQVCASSAALARGDRKGAVSELETARKLWDEAESYAQVFVRHSEIDAVWDAFFELNAALRGEEKQQEEAYLQLLYHLDSVEQMDHLHLGSIF